MRFVIKQKILSFADTFTIYDESNNPSYEVRGRLFAFGDKLTIYNLKNGETVQIEQKIFKLLPEYHFYQHNKNIAVVKKEFTLLRPRFNIKSIYGNFSIDGDFFGYNFDIKKENKRVASVRKAFFSFRDSYTVDIDYNEEETFLLGLCIVIDQVLHDNNHNNN